MRTFALRAAEYNAWDAVVESCCSHDVYHRAAYHRVAEQQCGSQGYLIGVETSASCVAIPLLIRPISELDGLEDSGLTDATSVYGYAGPVSSAERPSADDLAIFSAWLISFLREKGSVTAFSRLHPLMEQENILSACAGEVEVIGQTVAIDLTRSEQQQWGEYRSNHRRDINKAMRDGLIAGEDEKWSRLDGFACLYEEAMQRVAAHSSLCFSKEYFGDIRDRLSRWYHLFYVELQGELLCAGLFSLCRGTVQYHLGAVAESAISYAPLKLLLDFVRCWGVGRGAKYFHLGGGVSGRPDSLLHFKTGFSKLMYDFKIWKCVVDVRAYAGVLEELGLSKGTDDGYFPPYRVENQPSGAREAEREPG